MIFLRGQDVDVDRESSRLLAGIVRRDDLDGMVRDLAIEALAAGASAEDLRTFVALLDGLPAPLSAHVGGCLLRADPRYKVDVSRAREGWPVGDDYWTWETARLLDAG